jgi:hypothetical protein
MGSCGRLFNKCGMDWFPSTHCDHWVQCCILAHASKDFRLGHYPILALVDTLNEGTNSLIYQVETMRTHLPRADDRADVVDAKLRILTTHRSTCEFILRGRNSTLQELNSKFQQLMRRRQRIQAVIPEASEFFNQLDSGMKTILDDVDRRFADYMDKANAYDKALGEIKIPASG